MPRKGENIYKRKDGRWEGRFIRFHDFNGKAHYGYVYGKTYSDARQKLKEAHAQTLINNVETETKGLNKLKYEMLLKSWLESQKISIKESSYARYYQIIYNRLIPDIGYIQIDKITTKFVEIYISTLTTSGRIDGRGGLSSKTTRDILAIIKASILYGKYNNYPIKCNLNGICVRQAKREMKVLTYEEQQKLTQTLLSDTDLIKFGVLLSLYTGIRVGEVCALKWGDLDASTGVLSIKSTMQRIKNTSIREGVKTKILVTDPKSKCSIRDIPLPSFVRNIAESLRTENEAYILTGEKVKYIEPRTMQNRFKTILSESKIEDINYHSLRHTFATRCIEVGFEVKTLSEILGHSSVNITLNRYVHSSFDLKKENMDKIICIS